MTIVVQTFWSNLVILSHELNIIKTKRFHIKRCDLKYLARHGTREYVDESKGGEMEANTMDVQYIPRKTIRVPPVPEK